MKDKYAEWVCPCCGLPVQPSISYVKTRKAKDGHYNYRHVWVWNHWCSDDYWPRDGLFEDLISVVARECYKRTRQLRANMLPIEV